MFHFLGFALIFVLLQTAFKILDVDAQFYFDEVALLIVLGGTLVVTVIAFPLSYFLKIFSSPFVMLKTKKPNFVSAIAVIVHASKSQGRSKSMLRDVLERRDVDSFLKEGLELLLLGLSREEFKDIMTERIYRARQRDEERVSLFRRLSKYPPAFGLVGTVLGLVGLMRTVGEGASASEIGLKMALALVATLYGLAFANFFLVPIAEHYQQKAEDLKVYRELQLEGLLMIFDSRSPLAVQEMLNSYLEPKKRVDFIGIRESA